MLFVMALVWVFGFILGTNHEYNKSRNKAYRHYKLTGTYHCEPWNEPFYNPNTGKSEPEVMTKLQEVNDACKSAGRG